METMLLPSYVIYREMARLLAGKTGEAEQAIEMGLTMQAASNITADTRMYRFKCLAEQIDIEVPTADLVLTLEKFSDKHLAPALFGEVLRPPTGFQFRDNTFHDNDQPTSELSPGLIEWARDVIAGGYGAPNDFIITVHGGKKLTMGDVRGIFGLTDKFALPLPPTNEPTDFDESVNEQNPSYGLDADRIKRLEELIESLSTYFHYWLTKPFLMSLQLSAEHAAFVELASPHNVRILLAAYRKMQELEGGSGKQPGGFVTLTL